MGTTVKYSRTGVTVTNGVVTLSGAIDSYTEKMEAEDVARNVAGVKVVV